jgi:hypothetical protein
MLDFHAQDVKEKDTKTGDVARKEAKKTPKKDE